MVSRKSAALFLAAGVMLSAASQRVTHRVEIEGHQYRVTTDGSTVIAANKGAVVMFSVEERDRQRAAIAKATGCRIVDELPSQDARLRGKLDCSGRGAK